MFGKIGRTDFRYLTSVTFGIFWAILGLSYLFNGLSIAAEYIGISGMSIAFFQASFASLLMTTAPLAYFIFHVLLGDSKISTIASLIFMVVGIIGIILLFTLGVDGPYPDPWIPEFHIDQLLKLLFVFGLYVPSLCMILALLPFIALRRTPKFTQYKVTLALISLSLVYDFVLFGVLGIGGAPHLISNLFILLGALLGYIAFFPPDIVIRVLKLEPQEFEEYEGNGDL
ncbi:MAG: hypothetical protein SVM80_03670 [Halobacteriota archaeon]|nr:hypothetical protein [Halobacteriota archaeon]